MTQECLVLETSLRTELMFAWLSCKNNKRFTIEMPDMTQITIIIPKEVLPSESTGPSRLVLVYSISYISIQFIEIQF